MPLLSRNYQCCGQFITKEVALDPSQVLMYDTAAHVWNEIRKSLAIASSRVGSNQRVWATFWSAHQRFFKQLCMSMKVPAIVEEVKRAHSQDMAVVIGLQTTGESSLESELLQCDGQLTGFVSLCKEILQRFVREHFPTTSVSTAATQQVPIQDLWCVAAKDMLLEYIAKMQLPNSPLDDLIDQLGGPHSVAEMTGRKGRVVRGKGDKVSYEQRDSGGCALESLNNTERSAFMNGQKLIAIISDAASTGISLHSDLTAKNQSRRLHITMELPWSADKAVQQLGRSHRANQASGPLYMLMTTNVGGERRFAAAVAKRLQTLGALTKGDRRAATGAEFSEFNFDTQYGRSALRQMYNSLRTNKVMGGVGIQKVCTSSGADPTMSPEQFLSCLQSNLEVMGVEDGGTVKESDVGDVSRFLNRLLGLKVTNQNMMFAYFCECLSVVISIAKREGRFNEGVTDIKAQSIQMVGAPKEVFTDYRLSHIPTIQLLRWPGHEKLVTMPSEIFGKCRRLPLSPGVRGCLERGKVHTHVVVDRGVSWDMALQLYEQHISDHQSQEGSGPGPATSKGSGFYRSKREQYHRYLYLLALQKENSTHLFNITRPNTGRSFFEETKADLINKYVPVSPDKAEKGWKSQYEMTSKHCIHGSHCKNSSSCLVGSRLSHIHLLSGGVLPLLSLLESTLTRHAHTMALSREARSLRVVRVRLDVGRRVIGIRYPLPLISEISSMLSFLKHNKMGDNSKALPVVIPTSTKDLVTEAQSPINKRCLAKALTPPVSLKNFFSVQPKPLNNKDSDTPDRNQQDDSSRASATSQAPHRGDNKPSRSQPAGKLKGVQMKLLDSFAAPTRADCPIIIDNGGPQRQGPSQEEKEHSSKHRKRKSEPGSSNTSLPKMFKQAESLPVTTCPVCALKIEAASNSAINLHIDQCLAKSSSQLSHNLS